ncbi:MAG: hypothetical protein H7250_01865 [Flavobacterium sp.]|nr:hypothetical protein [Flavobacterium sp.]
MKIFLFIIIISITSFAQTKKEFIVEKETEIIFKQILQIDSLNIWVKESTKNSWLSECYGWINPGFLNLKEIKIISQKLKKDNQLSWKSNSNLNFKIVKDSLFEKSDRDKLVRNLNQNILVISHPIFLRKGNYCIIFYQWVCGNICGTSNLSLYTKIGKIWKKKEEYCDTMN